MSVNDSFNNIPEYQKAEFIRHIEEYQMKDSLKMYSNVVDMCFDKCVSGFRSKNLEENESRCLANCADKFLKVTQRTGFRFTEYQAEKSQQPPAAK